MLGLMLGICLGLGLGIGWVYALVSGTILFYQHSSDLELDGISNLGHDSPETILSPVSQKWWQSLERERETEFQVRG